MTISRRMLVVDGRKPRDVLACPSRRGEWRFRN
jgi:hypothetical protein